MRRHSSGSMTHRATSRMIRISTIVPNVVSKKGFFFFDWSVLAIVPPLVFSLAENNDGTPPKGMGNVGSLGSPYSSSFLAALARSHVIAVTTATEMAVTSSA